MEILSFCLASSSECILEILSEVTSLSYGNPRVLFRNKVLRNEGVRFGPKSYEDQSHLGCVQARDFQHSRTKNVNRALLSWT
ncbi:hypothetical protein AFLA_004168 [Aspergillus flavus NRRL3357]|nr:hypothetical protein AFLA_004168 [Aspergillus flavus NRRL3357]